MATGFSRFSGTDVPATFHRRAKRGIAQEPWHAFHKKEQGSGKERMKTSSTQLFLYICGAQFHRRPKGGRGICADYMEKTFTGVWLSGFKTSQLLTCRKSRWQPVASSWCVYPRAVSSVRGRRACCIHIGVGFLRCPFSTDGQCEGLETRNGRR